MSSTDLPKSKIYFLIVIIVIYAAAGISLKIASDSGFIEKAASTPFEFALGDIIPEEIPSNISLHIDIAKSFVEKKLTKSNKHINLHISFYDNGSTELDQDTNSEAVSYYLLWNAADKNKIQFDKTLDFVEKYMLHPNHNYLYWRLNSNDTAVDDGTNIASDADIRVLKSLFIAEKQWGGKRYSKLIDKLAEALEKVAITSDGMLAPYGGSSGNTSTWTAKEVWLSYSDFSVFEQLAQRRGEPWASLNQKMKSAVLKSQIENGLYNSQLNEERQYGNGIDDGGYSINSMWIMIRSAESNDSELRQSASKSLEFYKKKFAQDGELYSLYSSNGDALSPFDTPWVYALVGRAAIELGDKDFAEKMVNKMLDKQVMNTSLLYGSFPEDSKGGMKVGQFTMQESILTLLQFIKNREIESVR